MSNPPFGFLAVLATVALMFAGCSTDPAPEALPASDDGGKSESGHPRAVESRVTVSGRFLSNWNGLPEAKGPLAFLADDVGLRTGTVVLTQAEADAALVELALVTGQEVHSTRTVSMPIGDPTKPSTVVSLLRHPEGREEKDSIVINGLRFTVRPDFAVDFEVIPQAPVDGLVQLNVDVKLTRIDGFVEYSGQSVTLPGASDSVTVPSKWYQPVYSVNSVKADVRIASGKTLVLRGDRRILNSWSEKRLGAAAEPVMLSETVPETVLFFITATVESVKP